MGIYLVLGFLRYLSL